MLKEIDQLFKKHSEEHVLEQLEIMFRISSLAGAPAENRKQQLDFVLYYLKVKRKQKTVKILINLKEQLNLTGKFGAFDKPLVRIN